MRLCGVSVKFLIKLILSYIFYLQWLFLIITKEQIDLRNKVRTKVNGSRNANSVSNGRRFARIPLQLIQFQHLFMKNKQKQSKFFRKFCP